MKNILVLVACILAFMPSWTWAQNTEYNLNKNGVILEGYDPVSYFQSDSPKKGNPQIVVKRNQVSYWFSSDLNKQEFLKSPEKFEPQFGGWCAYAVADSKSKVEIDPLSFVIQDGRLLLFYPKSFIFGDTREKWLHNKTKTANTFLKEADANWPAIKTKEP